MVEAYKAAVAAGIDPLAFWQMTPYLTKQAIRAANEEQITQTWILASLTRMKKLPKLEKLLRQESTAKGDMEARLKSALMGLGKKKGA